MSSYCRHLDRFLSQAIDGTDFFFTLEAREQMGEYEAALPGSGVIIQYIRSFVDRNCSWIGNNSGNWPYFGSPTDARLADECGLAYSLTSYEPSYSF